MYKIQNKYIYLILLLIIVGIVLLVVFLRKPLATWRLSNEIQDRSEKMIEALEAPFKADFSGGKTPEETLAIFVELIKNGELRKASMLYDVQHQEEAFKRLERLKSAGLLDKWVSNILTMEKDREQVGGKIVYYSYKYYDKDTGKTLWAPIAFYLNPFTKIWKIVY